ncbi:MAG TPA: 2-C-methyl-D-erythritol 4-phosphate cytidylyltransferase [Bacteroidales bacterium]|nr:2-C-methyl-D-erythritol 4-phosphate cytidylyltransferase [Bacteroidales bacterium]HPS17534.1 2-C-methyl-D-erythritol 4-phosphate cytidylyltransferase [Bacteroidales bacterium]
MKKYVIIAAGGLGIRMKSEIPKQFICISGKPILMRTLEAFKNYDILINIILVLPEEQKSYWKNLCELYNFNIKHTLVSGGGNRFHSVKNGLAQIKEEECLIAVHDGVRPFVSKEIIEKAFKCAEKNGNAVPCTRINDSLRYVEEHSSKPINREKVFAIQTPQCFSGKILKQAYEQDFDVQFTDDATVVEKLGHKIFLTEGSSDNIKITTQKDLILAEVILEKIINPQLK